MNALELQIAVTNTAAFIAADSIVLTILREHRVDDGAGGSVATLPETVVDDVAFRLIPQQDKVTASQTFNGTVPRPAYVLMAPANTLVLRGDYYLWLGYRWNIGYRHEGPPYEAKFDVEQGEKQP